MMGHASARFTTGANTRFLLLLGGSLIATSAVAQLEEITVTAERREADLQSVPVAVSAYNDVLFEKMQVQETLDLINLVPNLFGGNNTGLGTANMYYLRAQGNDESIATFDPPVGTYIDDVYVSRQNANNYAFFDVDRIEVLRGPQGTLFGRNTTGGAVNMVLKKPGEELGGFAEFALGRFSETWIRGSIDLPVNDKFLTKFSVFSVQDDGFLDNTNVGGEFNDKDSLGVRVDLRFMPTDTITWDLAIDFIDDSEANIYGRPVGDDRISTSVLPLGLPAGFTQKADGYGNDTENLNIVSNLGFELGQGTMNVILGYRELEQQFLLNFPGAPGSVPIPGVSDDDFFWIDNDGQHDQFTLEVKWNATLFDDKVDLVTGIFYLDEDNSTDFADYLFAAIPLADRVIDNTAESWAVYAQADIAVGERGTLTVGARYTDEEKEIGLQDNLGTALTTANLIAAGVPTDQSESIVTPRIAYSYEFSENTMGYLSATRGFKSGGWNARGSAAVAFQPFGPETLWSYEAGWRADYLDDRLRVNTTLFYTDLEDLQTTAATPSGQFLTTNAGGLEVTGLEFEITAIPTENWDIFFAGGFQDAEYQDLPGGCVAPNTSPCRVRHQL